MSTSATRPELPLLQAGWGMKLQAEVQEDYTFWSGGVFLTCPIAQTGGNWDVCFQISTQLSLVDLNFPLPNPFLAALPFFLFSHTWIQTPLLTPTFQHSHTSLLFYLNMFKTHSERISLSSPWWKKFTVACLWPLPFPQDLCKASDSSWQWLGGGQVVQGCLVPRSRSTHLSTSWLETLQDSLVSLCMHEAAWLLNMRMFPAWQSNLFLNEMRRHWEGDEWLEPAVNYRIPGLPITVPMYPQTVNLKNCCFFCEGYFSGTQISKFGC